MSQRKAEMSGSDEYRTGMAEIPITRIAVWTIDGWKRLRAVEVITRTQAKVSGQAGAASACWQACSSELCRLPAARVFLRHAQAQLNSRPQHNAQSRGPPSEPEKSPLPRSGQFRATSIGAAFPAILHHVVGVNPVVVVVVVRVAHLSSTQHSIPPSISLS